MSNPAKAKKVNSKSSSNKKSKSKKTNGKKLPVHLYMFLLLIILALGMFLPFAVVLIVGMSPTITSYITNRERAPMAALTIGSINICGVLPALFSLWATEGHLSDAIDKISDPFNLLMMFGAAGIGWVIWEIVPRLYATTAVLKAQRRLSLLKKAKDAIIDEWGADIVMSPIEEPKF